MDSFGILGEENNQRGNSGAVIIPVASGKGGVGKTFMAANLAMALAEAGHRVVAADLDFGFVFKDRSVVESIRNRRPFLPNYRRSPAAENIVRITGRIEKFWHQPVNDSAALLYNHVKRDFEARRKSSVA